MEDRFKFRCYNKILRKMFDVKCMSYINGIVKRIEVQDGERILIFNEWKNNIDNTVLVQCTGRKDKNGKLIYEGDIVKDNQNLLYSVEFVEFEYQTKICLKRIENPDYYSHISTWQGIGYKDQKNYEVIGNIYENKELLESEG